METISSLQSQRPFFQEMLILDQTKNYEKEIENELASLDKRETIRWIRIEKPSIPHAMNLALLKVKNPLILFLDDDIIPHDSLVERHLFAHNRDPSLYAVVGRVIQPWDGAMAVEDLNLPKRRRYISRFNSRERKHIADAMAGNLSVKRTKAIDIGGFDENFIDAAYMFEKDFADRIIADQGKILYEPTAAINHLKVSCGGIRSYGDFRQIISPAHCVGAYYYFFTSQKKILVLLKCLRRLVSAVCTRHNLVRPWWIPIVFISECRGLLKASQMARQGKKLINNKYKEQGKQKRC